MTQAKARVKAPASGAAVYTMPRAGAPAAGRLYSGTIVTRGVTEGGFVRVATANVAGWVEAKRVKFEAV